MSKTQKFIDWLNSNMNKNPLAVIVLSLLFCSIFIAGLPNFKISSAVREYLGESNPLVVNLVELEDEYTKNVNVFVMMLPTDGNVFSNAMLSSIEQYTELAWQTPHVLRVDSLSNFQHTQVDGDDLIIADLIGDAVSLTAEQRQKIKQYALSEPSLVNLFVSEKGHAAALNISFDVNQKNPHELVEITEYLQNIQAIILADNPNIEFYESGYANMVYHWDLATTLDAKKVFSFAIIAILIGLIYFLGNIRAALAVYVTGLLSVATGLGLLGFLDLKLNGASMLCTLMVLILGLADGIHITKTARRLIAEGMSQQMAVVESVSINFIPVLLTSVTTAIGFLTFNASTFAGIVIQGNYTAFGVMMAFLLSITLLPAMLLFCNLNAEKDSNKIPMALSNFIIHNNRKLIGISIPILLIAIYCISFNEIDERNTRYLDKDYPFSVDLEKIQNELTGATNMMYNFNSGEAGGVSSPEFMRKVAAFVEWSLQQPEVRHVSAYTDTMKRLNQNMNGGDAAYYRLPKDQNLAAQYMLLYELSLPYGLDLTNQINIDKSGTRVTLTTNDVSIVQAKSLIARNNKWLEENAPTFSTITISDSIATLLGGELTIKYAAISAMFALGIIGLILLCTFRSWSAGSLCVLSVISPIIATYGLWGVVVGRAGVPAATAICIVIGLSVDFSVHFISKFVYARRQLNKNAEECVHYAISTVSSPILTSTVVLGGGFLILTLSLFEYAVVTGWLTALCVFFSAFASLLLIPSLLLVERFSVK